MVYLVSKYCNEERKHTLQNLKNIKEEIDLPIIALLIVAAVLPLAVRVATVSIPPEIMPMSPDFTRMDLFSYNRGLILMFCTAVAALYIISEFIVGANSLDNLKKGAHYKNPAVIILAVYLFFVILSNILSPYTHTALWGLHDRREGLFVQISYVILLIIAMFYIKNKTHVKMVLTALCFSSILMGLVGFSQFINRDFFATDIAAVIVGMPAGIGLNIRFDTSYATTSNPNTYGLVTAMLAPLLLSAAIAFKGIVWKAAFITGGVLMLAGLVGSTSVGGFIGGAAAVAAVVITLSVSRLLKAGTKSRRAVNKRALIITAAAAVVLTAGIGFVLRQPIYDNLSFVMGRINAIFEPPQVNYPLFDFDENTLSISDRGVTYQIEFPLEPDGPISFFSEGSEIIPQVDTHLGEDNVLAHNFRFYVPGLGNRVLTGLLELNSFSYRNIFMQITAGRIYLVYRQDRLIDPNEPIPSFGFTGWETWGSNRGFIFARSIPLIPQFIFLGSGSDTFILQFPQHDIISKAQYFGNPFIIVDKAHNLYLQTAITTGLISALALIVLFSFFLITTFVSLIKYPADGDSFYFWIKLGILASVSAFSVSSLSTDSTLSSTPIFLIIIGMGFALSRHKLTEEG